MSSSSPFLLLDLIYARFLQHPWSNLTSTFLNLEGAGGGGRPLLFRSTSPSLLDALKTDKYAHPHANVFSADAFSRGVIASGTDYSVYSGPRLLNSNVSPKGGNDTASQGGMQGVDLAFYKGRNRYHTKLDAMAYTEGGKRSLWSMMESARAAADGFVFGDIVESKDKKNDDDEREEDTVEGAVWFDGATCVHNFSLPANYCHSLQEILLPFLHRCPC